MGGEVPFTRCVAVHQVAPSGLGASWRHVSWRQFLKKKLFKCSTSWSRFLRSKRCHFPTHIHLATSLPEAELQALHKEDHDAEIKAIAEAEQRWEGILAQTKEDAKAARASYSKLKKHEEAPKINYLKLRSMAVKYGEMGKDAETTTDLNRMRMLNFEQESKSFAREITAGIAAVSVLKRKYETADSAGMLYTKTWRAGGCESATAKKDTDPEVPDKLQSDEPVVTKYSPTECASDKHIATQNLEGAAAAKLAHLTELAHLTSAKENHANAVTGAKTAKSIMAFTKVKSKRYLKVAKSALKQSADPCDS